MCTQNRAQQILFIDSCFLCLLFVNSKNQTQMAVIKLIRSQTERAVGKHQSVPLIWQCANQRHTLLSATSFIFTHTPGWVHPVQDQTEACPVGLRVTPLQLLALWIKELWRRRVKVVLKHFPPSVFPNRSCDVCSSGNYSSLAAEAQARYRRAEILNPTLIKCSEDIYGVQGLNWESEKKSQHF